MFRFVVTTFKDDDFIDTYWTPTTNGRALGDIMNRCRVQRTQLACTQRQDDMVDASSGTMFFFHRKDQAESFALHHAAKYPNWNFAISEITQLYCSETPKVVAKAVNEKGVLPL